MSANTSESLPPDIFLPKERLLVSCPVGNYLKKKKTSTLCIVRSTSSPFNIAIVQIKQTEKQSFKRKRSWLLDDLRWVDCHNDLSDTREFDLHFDKVYKWIALGLKEKHMFIYTLWKQASKTMKDIPTFKNIQSVWFKDYEDLGNNFSSSSLLQIYDENDEDFQAITENEQESLSSLLMNCDIAISNTEMFMEELTRNLSLLDGKNIQCILASEDKVDHFMNELDSAIIEAEDLQEELDDYDEILGHVKETMEKMDRKNSMIAVVSRNNQLLLDELEKTVECLNFPRKYHEIIENADLTTEAGLHLAIEAGNALKKVKLFDVDHVLLQMSAVQEQKKRFERYAEIFARNISRYLNNLFVHCSNSVGRSEKHEILATTSLNMHKKLQPYTDLMHCIKVMDFKSYSSLKAVYIESFKKLYENNLKHIFDVAKEKIEGNENLIVPTTLIGQDRELWTIEITIEDRKKIDLTLNQVLSQLDPVCFQEQQFCTSFFQVSVEDSTYKHSVSYISNVSILSQRKSGKEINEEIKAIMTSLFSCVKSELDGLINTLKKQDSFFSMYVLVRLHEHALSAKSSFLSNTIGSSLIEVKRLFDQFMTMQIESVKEFRLTKKLKSGILPYVFNLEEFTVNAECLLKSDRRADLEKWYSRLLDIIVEYISIHSNDNGRTPPQIIKIENYHYLYLLLSQLKISVLDSQKKEAKQRYNEALQSYVTLYFGRPLEKLNAFFEGVQAKVAGGVKMSEVSYHLAFNKHELRKVIQQYPGATVKKGLESLYKKVEKHLTEESNLLQVVWRAMQEEFIQQYKTLEDLIQQCYPGSLISLEFSIDDILCFFSDIARSH